MISNPSPEEEERESIPGRSDGFLLRGENRRTLTVTEALSLLANDRRRSLLFVLRDAPPEKMDVETVIERIAEREHTSSAAANGQDVREPIHVSLVHRHIPKLEKAGVIEHHRRDETLEYVGDPVLDMYLGLTREIEPR